jgi:uncharacterized protein involved in exopolysaccharide biosynthesis
VSLTSKLVARQRDFDRLAQFDLRAHYEDVAASTLHSIVRHLPLITGLAAITLVTAGLLVSWLPRQYSAETLVSPDFFLYEDNSKQAPLASIEGALLVNSEARFISSPAMVHAVVKRLGLDGDPDFVAPSGAIFRGLDWVKDAILPESVVNSPLEQAASRVGQRLTVTVNPRSYLISVSFTCSSPEKAANIANAFALEYLRAKATQRLTDAVTMARRKLAQQSSIYGDRHPSVVRAKAELGAARIRLQGAINRAEAAPGETLGGAVTLAEPNPTPTGPRGHVILGVALALALTLGIGCAIWLDRQQASVGELGSKGNKASTRANEI